MSVSSVSSTTSSSSSTADAVTSATTQTLSEQDFLNLLVTQMTSQDPLNPMTNQDMVSQMVQFSTLQSNTEMQTLLSNMEGTQAFTEANALVGQTVELETDSSGDTTTGVVSGLDLSSGTPEIVVDGTSYSLSQVLSVTPASTTTTSSTN